MTFVSFEAPTAVIRGVRMLELLGGRGVVKIIRNEDEVDFLKATPSGFRTAEVYYQLY